MSKYFSALFGNEATKARIGRAITDGTLPHAFLVSGPEGSGKATLATEIAAALNCERRGGGELPCHMCNSCRRIKDGSFIDVKWLEKPKDKMTIGVGEVRTFREDMFLSATESDYKIYIIDDADRMTPNAQNALLKVFEEPPANVVIFMLTESDDAILTTIKSRAQYVAMERFDEDGLIAYFKSRGTRLPVANEDTLRELMMCADGRIGRAKELVEGGAEEAKAARELTESFITALKQSTPYSTLYTTIRSLPTKKDELCEALESITVALRDLMLLKYDATAPLLFYPDRAKARELADGMSARRLMRIYDIISDSLDDLARNVNVSAMTTALGAKIKLI